MQPIRRDLDFKLPAERVLDWHPAGEHVAHFLNTLSIVFPVGERYFIESVRHYRDNGTITDPQLLKEVRAFIGQEAMHGREHEDYNAAYAAAGANAKGLEAGVLRLLNTLQARLPKSFSLASTIALEHYTAILANALLEHPELIEGAEPHFKALWNWHALEETEHKSVAFDVWQTIMYRRDPHAYLVRVSSLLIASGLFWVAAFSVYAVVLKQEGVLFKASGWRVLTHYTVGRVGLLRKVVKPWFAYFRPGFHPWDHDNRHFLERLEALESKISRFA